MVLETSVKCFVFIIFFKWLELDLFVIENPILEPAKENALEKLLVMIKFGCFFIKDAEDKSILKSTYASSIINKELEYFSNNFSIWFFVKVFPVGLWGLIK